MNKVKIGKTAVAVALCAAAWAAGAAERIELNGAGTLLKWPCGIAGQKNPGVCNGVRRIRGAAVEPTSVGWPILGKTYILVRKDTPPARRAALQAYFDWCFAKGGDTAKRLFYIPGAR